MSNKKAPVLLAEVVGLGWYLALCIVGGAAGGFWLDGRLGTKPLLTLIGLLLGIGLGFYGLYRIVAPLMDSSSDDGKNS
ncbi:MAG: putative F0F1-ATPase subunit Ca2+/Mg2+ transporter [Chloroflexi bacterium]|jgi:F0F1-type ATP synthase assembly protein I|nr:MAG: putative F0F1-ATPase subunit Ca2+/Mg2+ transporter [Chloroflexota bacterium]